MSDLRSRLYDMRAGLVGRLEKRIEGGDLALLGTVHGALSAVDEVPEEAVPAARAVVADDGEVIRLVFYAEDGAACGLELDPARAVRLAGRLIEAASARLARLACRACGTGQVSISADIGSGQRT